MNTPENQNTSDYWEPQAPSESALADHDVPQTSTILAGRKIALLISGGIAAFKAPQLARSLRKHGAKVTAFVSQEALRYVTEAALAWSTDQAVITRLSPRAEHLGDGLHYDAYLLAPATYNTLNKFRYGIADSLISTVLAAALGKSEQGQSKILVAPTMHGSMHTSILEESLLHLQSLGVVVLPPRNAYGKHNLPDEEEIAYRTARALSNSNLRGRSIMVTGGPTPVPVDDIRRLTNRFTGQLGLEIAKALFVAGAEVHWVHGGSNLTIPDWLPCARIDSFNEYQQTVHHLLEYQNCEAAIFSAAVADYQAEHVASGKLPSGGELQEIRLKPTPKIIQEVRQTHPDIKLISFKFEANLSHQELVKVARQRLQTSSDLVIANRAEEQEAEQIAWLISSEQEQRLAGKAQIAAALVDWLEKALGYSTLELSEAEELPPIL